VQCQICGCDQSTTTNQIEGYRKGAFFDIYECTQCGVSWAGPLEADNEIYNAIYRNAEYIGGYNGYIKIANSIKSKSNPLRYLMYAGEPYFFVATILNNDRLKRDDQFIVEIGCGQGYLTFGLVKAGMRAMGIDISTTAISAAQKRFGDFYHCGTLQSFIAEKGVVPTHIVCTELIEHLEDPLSFFSGVLSCLPRGGKLLVTTPLKKIEENTFWSSDLPPVHLWWFTRKSLLSIADQTAAKVSFFDKFDEYYETNGIRKAASPSGPYENKPVFDENYSLINPEKRLPPGTLREFIKDKLPVSVMDRLRKIRANMHSVPLRRSDESATLCAIYEKI
jgi:SAM-dependent methyltransferase